MVNAKKEILDHIGEREVDCIKIAFVERNWEIDKKDKVIKFNSIDELDFEYDDGYGTKSLFGFIWYTDGTWSERGEYDGSEWWEHKEIPSKDCEIETF
jgi:hypothetical protein